MNERVVEILVLIMREIKDDGEGFKNLETISRDLIQQGYTENEISSAFSWLLDRIKSDSEELMRNEGAIMDGSFRHLHEMERSVLSTEAYGYLIQLKTLGIVDELQIEQILERSLMLGLPSIGVHEIKSIVASVLFSPDNLGDGSFFLFDEHPQIH